MKRLGDAKEICLTGKFSPFLAERGVSDQPVFLTVSDARAFKWVTVFSTVEKLHEMMELCGVKDYKIKHIQDGKEFAFSILEDGRYRIMLDPRMVDGKVRWTEVEEVV